MDAYHSMSRQIHKKAKLKKTKKREKRLTKTKIDGSEDK